MGQWINYRCRLGPYMGGAGRTVAWEPGGKDRTARIGVYLDLAKIFN